MNYHDTVPSEDGFYITPDGTKFQRLGAFDMWLYGGMACLQFTVEQNLPLLGPLPATQDEALALACDVAFARMSFALNNARHGVTQKLYDQYHDLLNRFMEGLRSLSLLRDMQRVTGELTGGTP